MSPVAFGLAMLGLLLVLLAARMPIGVAMMAVGMAGYVALSGWGPLLAYLKTAAYWRFGTYDLSVIPLFLLMGQFATRAGMSRALFDAASAWLGRRPGGLAMAAVGACAGFGAICGSSLATAATMGQVALPELRRHRYAPALATGALAAGGTLGILIPPSVVLVIYAILTEGNIVTMFEAALIPGIVAALGYMAAVSLYVRLHPGAGPPADAALRRRRWRTLAEVWPVGTIFLLVIGGIYAGLFTPTEGAAVGAAATALLALARGRLDRRGLAACLLGAASATAMIYLILLGAEVLNAFLALTRLPAEAARLIGGSGLPPHLVLAAMLLLYLALGCVMDSLSMILLTVPIFWPVVAALDFGLPVEDLKIWFGILALVVVEVGLITPPVGMNVFVIHGMAPDVRLGEIYRGVVPFLLSDALRVLLLVAFPALTLWLPHALAR
ncbi:TRAP transporter large permease [Inmirania thermothiophila]|uniref:TRAP transporter large permease protein n=1 Tax=Inmirania thermothiophila TaxID=1750597 RepID=A0A3N1Y018_9GAMM|nr:TRAP transporter large permease [Inmirania thermothiophila]ROR32194.1 tripartite ATP-independent transporter DctM subunit [Inmirania thermothiophila]